MSAETEVLHDRRFHDLMPFRVREVLLVSSPYDAFILEEDGQLTDQVFFEYRDVSLSGPPRVTHVASGEEALKRLETQRFDLILVMSSLAGMGVSAFGKRIKATPKPPSVVLLALDRKELTENGGLIDSTAIDGTFLWTGDSQILLAIFKFIEDRENVDHDIQHGNVRVIIMIEDSPRYYSSYLGILYKELMIQSHSLYAEGVNELHRRMYMRSRPKILHATSYESAVELFQRYRHNVMAVISDIRIPRGGQLDPRGGLEVARFVRRFDPELPILLESAESAAIEEAAEIGTVFVDKSATNLLAEIRLFFRRNLGFGDFVFTGPNGEELARARGVRELARQLAVVPEESLVFHAAHHHFSIWLMARSEFELAERLRPRQISDFPSVEALRQYLVDLLRETHSQSHRGVIADFSRKDLDRNVFSRIDQGSLGGKGRGIAFLSLTLANTTPQDFAGLQVQVPRTVVITTDRFDEFLDANQLREFAYTCEDDHKIALRFLEGHLSDELRSDLTFIAHQIQGPLAIRSSSLLEDSMHQPMAGIYNTLMIPNRARDPETRLREICSAIKLVYASTFYRNAKSYLRSTGNRVEEEKMAVIIQKLIGHRHGDRFYPSFAGVAQSHNFYPIGPQKAEEGIVHEALGLGRLVVDGGLALRFSPRHPGVLPQHASPKSWFDSSQRDFYALDLEAPCCQVDADLYSNIKTFELADAEKDGTLLPVGSVFSADDQTIRDDLRLPGPRIVTFNNILKYGAIPLSDALARLLEIGEQGMGAPVEIEFACDMGDWGRPLRAGLERVHPVLFPLQIRPFSGSSGTGEIDRREFAPGEILCSTDTSLGHGVISDIRDVIYVPRDRWDAAESKKIAHEVGQLNQTLSDEERPYLLIGPGRWGTADPWLGIPVQWSQISNVKVLIEASPKGYDVEPSQGTHFFQNITSLSIGYLTVPPGADRPGTGDGSFLDANWLDDLAAHGVTEHLRHLRLEKPLRIVLDGRHGVGVIAKPEDD